jgi:nitrogen-specific signal transduction histidine kinase
MVEYGPQANEARLVQVLVNMLMNAWQALPAPDPTRHVIGLRTGTSRSSRRRTSAPARAWASLSAATS